MDPSVMKSDQSFVRQVVNEQMTQERKYGLECISPGVVTRVHIKCTASALAAIGEMFNRVRADGESANVRINLFDIE